MRVAAVVVDPASQSPVLILRGLAEPRLYLPIFIGGLEATAIATFLAQVEVPRPLTHDLLATVVQTLGWQVRRVTITRLADGTFFAEVTLTDGAGGLRHLDARPSDSVALALRAGAPIFVAQDVLEEAGGFADETDAEAEAAALVDDDTLAAHDDAALVGDEVAAEPEPEPALALTGSDDVRLEDLDPDLFGKYKM